MALSKIYTDNTVVKKNNGGSIAWVATKTYKELFGENEFDLSILLNNSSTSKMLNNGAYGKNPTKYLELKTIVSGEPTVPIQFLGCFLSTTDSITNSYGFNITKKAPFINENLDGDSWTTFINNFRFVIDFIPATNNISYETYQDFDYNNTTSVKYGFSTSYIEFNAEYKKSNISTVSSTTKNPELISGDDAKRFVYSNVTVATTNYNKYLDDTTPLTKEWLCLLWYAFRVNDNLIIIRYPEYMPTSGNYRTMVELQNDTYEFLTIGGFSDTVIDGTIGGLPENDDTKGLFVSYEGRGYNYYYSTNNAIIHNTNSSGIRWTVNDITTAKNFRDYVRLGVMDANGLITHNEWIQGESGIANSDNPNKNGNYSDLPKWDFSGDLNDDIDDTLLGRDLYVNGFVNYFQVTAGNLTDISTAISNETEKTGLLNNVISLKSYVVPTSTFLSEGSTTPAPITLNGVTVLESAPKIVAHSMKFHLGDYTINGRYGNALSPHFLDKNPYTIIELYIPFCGIVTLPDKCMYNTISVDLLSDLFSGGCIAVVKCNGAIVAEKSGIIGFDIPLSSLNTAELSHALINNVLKSVDIGANTIISGATGNVGGILSGAMTGVNNMLSMYHTANLNYTTIVGNSGSKSEYALPPQCYVKITTKIVKYPDNYAHTVGKPCYKTKKLSDCKGFTVCENVNINVSATDAEKQMIKRLLENGIYI